MACDDRQLTQAQLEAGFQNARTGVTKAIRPFSGEATPDSLADYLNKEVFPVLQQARNKLNEVYLQVTDNAPSGNPLAFYFSDETGAADPTAGRIRLDAATQNTATTIRVSQENARLVDVAPWLDVMAGGATTPLGTVTLFDVINPGRFIRWDLDTMTDQGDYWDLGVTIIESSHDNPFVDGGAVVVAFIPGVSAAGSTVPVGSLGDITGPTVLGRTTTDGAGPPTELTPAELGEIARYPGVQTVATGGTIDDLVLTDDSIHTVIFTGTTTLNSILSGSAAAATGRRLHLFAATGTGNVTTIPNNGVGGAFTTDRFQTVAATTQSLNNGSGLSVTHRVGPSGVVRWCVDSNVICPSTSIQQLNGQVVRAALTGPITATQNSNATNIAASVAGAGLTLTTNVLAVGAGTNVTVNANDVAVDNFPLTGLADQADDTFLANISGGAAPPTAVALTTLAGAGLTGGANAVLAVGAGDGIDVNADDVAVDVTDIIDNVTITEVATNNIQRAALTGFAAASAGSNATTSAEPIVTYSASANMSAERVTTSSTSVTVSTSVASQIEFQRAALTGEVTASANSNATTITRSTNFDWTGAHSFTQAITGVSNGAIDIDTGGAGMDIANTDGITLTASGATLQLTGGPINVGSSTSVSVTANDNIDLQSGGGNDLVRIVTGFLGLNEKSTSTPVLSGTGYAALWVQNQTPNALMFTDDVDADWEVGYACVSVNITTPTATNATTNLSCGGSFTVPADSWRAGTLYRFTGVVVYDHAAAATPTITAELLINGAVVTTSITTPMNLARAFDLHLTGYIRCQTTGAGGTVMCTIEQVNSYSVQGAGTSSHDHVIGDRGTATTAIDTTVSRSIEMRVRMTTAVASNTLTVTQGFVERLA